jgi:hypothetical protein
VLHHSHSGDGHAYTMMHTSRPRLVPNRERRPTPFGPAVGGWSGVRLGRGVAPLVHRRYTRVGQKAYQPASLHTRTRNEAPTPLRAGLSKLCPHFDSDTAVCPRAASRAALCAPGCGSMHGERIGHTGRGRSCVKCRKKNRPRRHPPSADPAPIYRPRQSAAACVRRCAIPGVSACLAMLSE